MNYWALVISFFVVISILFAIAELRRGGDWFGWTVATLMGIGWFVAEMKITFLVSGG